MVVGPHSKIQLTAEEAELFIWTCTYKNKFDWRPPSAYECTRSRFNKTANMTWTSYRLTVADEAAKRGYGDARFFAATVRDNND